mmetsp:Transcript_103842/g.178880  ORF Transcript_103842/g.178880 Transcript_103842/m.178880 type:complete len:200 (+) Transcript_103842:3592-4191(+)
MDRDRLREHVPDATRTEAHHVWPGGVGLQEEFLHPVAIVGGLRGPDEAALVRQCRVLHGVVAQLHRRLVLAPEIRVLEGRVRVLFVVQPLAARSLRVGSFHWGWDGGGRGCGCHQVPPLRRGRDDGGLRARDLDRHRAGLRLHRDKEEGVGALHRCCPVRGPEADEEGLAQGWQPVHLPRLQVTVGERVRGAEGLRGQP